MSTNNLENEFFGIGIFNGKTPENLGVLWRSAQNMGASFIFTIGNSCLLYTSPSPRDA